MTKIEKKLFLLAAVMGALAVIVGAFGAHGLKGFIADNNLPIERLDIYKTGVSYHFYHVVAMFIALGMSTISETHRRLSAWLFFIGIVLFSGSLYLLSVREYIPIPTAILGPATPIGGLFFITGWLNLAWGILSTERKDT